MHKDRLCQKILKNALQNSIHRRRRDCLVRFTSSMLDYDATLTLTEIGNRLKSNTSIKHKIKASDYFLGNEKFSRDIPTIYQSLACYFFGAHKELIVNVDWSGACIEDFYVLEASVVAHGRSIPIYNEIHKRKDTSTIKAHDSFLENLYQVIPVSCSVTIVTDAGFRRDWFHKVAALGWHYIGRIYNGFQYRRECELEWKPIAEIPFAQKGKPTAVGHVMLGKTRLALSCYLYTYKEQLSGKPHPKHPSPTHEKAHSKYYRGGWVLVSSLNKPANVLVKFYKKRMQIEQNFRDIKNERYGIGLRRSRSNGLVRTRMLYFLGTIINIFLWWFGLVAETKGLHRRYQANTVRHKRVISLVALGRRIVRHEPKSIRWRDFKQIAKKLSTQYFSFIECGVLI